MSPADEARCRAVATSDDAWAFELEALCHVGTMRLLPMRDAAQKVFAGLGKYLWEDMTEEERVRSLLLMGRARNLLRLPCVQVPTFARLAAAS